MDSTGKMLISVIAGAYFFLGTFVGGHIVAFYYRHTSG